MNTNPYLIQFPSLGSLEIGYICISEFKDLPFLPKRIFWAFHTPNNVVRGKHAHHNTEMVLIALSGTITVYTEMPNGDKQTIILDKATEGVFLPKYCWHTMKYSHTAVQLVITSSVYEEKDYIRDYDEFLNIYENNL